MKLAGKERKKKRAHEFRHSEKKKRRRLQPRGRPVRTDTNECITCIHAYTVVFNLSALSPPTNLQDKNIFLLQLKASSSFLLINKNNNNPRVAIFPARIL